MNSRILGWWYICIGAGFVALGARAGVAGAPLLSIALRFAIAAGFLSLGWFTMSGKRK